MIILSPDQQKAFPEASDFLKRFEAAKDQQEQKEVLVEANERYRTGAPVIPDEVYDQLLIEAGLEDGLDGTMDLVIEGREVRLPITMTSIKKAKNEVDIQKWAKSKGISPDEIMVLTPKFDGNSMCIDMDHDKLALAATRGATAKEGIGTDCTSHLRMIPGVFTGKPLFDRACFAGELILSRSKFMSVFQSLDYSFPRGVPAGLMRDENPDSELIKHLSFIKYRAVMPGHTFELRSKELDFCNAYNEIQVPYLLLPFKELTEERLLGIFRKWAAEDFDIDGLVIDVNDVSKHEQIGRETSTNNPGWARAYKGKFEVAYATKIKFIEYNVSKYGVINPRLELEAVVIDGNEITSTYPDNARSVTFYDMKAGDTVQMIRSGQVIPRMSEVNGKPYKPSQIDRKFRPTKMPISNCPCCGGELTWDENFVQLMCLDIENKCSAQRLHKIIAFFEIVGIKFLSDQTFEELYNRGFDTVGKVYSLKVSDMSGWPKWGQSRAENAKQEIGKTLGNLKFITVMHASSCFKGLGSKKLVLAENILIDCYTNNKPLPQDQLLKIDGYADKSVAVIVKGFDAFRQFVQENNLTLITAEQKPKIEITGNNFKGQVILFSGFRDKGIEAVIMAGGGQVVDSYSKKVTTLVLQDLNSTSSKTKKAQADGCKIVSRTEFAAQVGPVTAPVTTDESKALW